MSEDDHDTPFGAALKEIAAGWSMPPFDASAIAAESRIRTRNARRRAGALLIGLFAIAGGTVAGATFTGGSNPSVGDGGPHKRSGQALLATPALPTLCDRSTLENALATKGFSVKVPNVTLANQSSLTDIWQCPGAVVEEFSSGLSVGFERNGIINPAAAWERLAANDPSEASVGTVQGQPAALIRPSAGALGSVTFVASGTIVYITGNGHASLQDLVDLANSMSR